MKESYRKGVANHLASSLAGAVVRPQSKRRQRNQWAGYRASKRQTGAPTLWTEGEGYTGAGVRSQVRRGPCVVEDPRHAEKLHAREPGDLIAGCKQSRQSGRRRRTP